MEDTQQVKTRYEFTDAKATAFGGLFVFSEFLKQIKFHEVFDSVFGPFRRIRKYHPAENVSLQMASIIAGGERLYDIQYFHADPVIPELFSHGEVPRDTTLRDDLLHLGTRDPERQELLFRLHEQHFQRLGIKEMTIDIDGAALPVDGHQEGAEKGYCPEEPGSRCFQSLSAICDETETVLAEELRPGNTHCASGIGEFCKTILDRFAPQMDTIGVRLDKGFFSAELLKLLESYPNVTYRVGIPQHEWLQTKVRTLAYKPYHGSERQYASFAYGEGLQGSFRYYYVERKLKEPGTQLDVFDPDRYHYRVVVSNQGHLQPHTLFRHYNGRGRYEKHIEELKNQYALGKMISGHFSVTKALVWLSCLTFTLIGMLRKVAFRWEMAKYRLKRLRWVLFTAVAAFVQHARQKVLNLAIPRLGATRLKFLLQRIWAY
jgi:hypothetical protein